ARHDLRPVLAVRRPPGEAPPGDPQRAAQPPQPDRHRRLGLVQQAVDRDVTPLARRVPAGPGQLHPPVHAERAAGRPPLAPLGLPPGVLRRGKNSTPWSRSASARPSGRPYTGTRPSGPGPAPP